MVNFGQIRGNKVRRLTAYLLNTLKDKGIYLYHVSRYDSVYLKFKDERLGSIRIADHTGRTKYRYKWNLEIDGKTRVAEDRGVTRHYYNSRDVCDLADKLLKLPSTHQAIEDFKDV